MLNKYYKKKNLKLLFTIWIIASFICTSNAFSYTLSSPEIEKVYKSFVVKVQKKYSDNKELIFLKELDKALENILKIKKLSNSKENLIKDLIYLNKNQISLYYENREEQEVEIINLESNEQDFQNKLRENNNKTKIDSYSISKEFKNISYDKNDIFLENGVWYTYNFITYKFFETTNIRINDLNHNNINPQTDLLFLKKEDWELGFVEKAMYEKVRLISDEIIKGTPNKYNLLIEIKDDKKSLSDNTDLLFKQLKEKSVELTKWLSTEEKIAAIYNYILENIHYTENLDFQSLEILENKKIFSGIETFRNKNWVCEWYTKLFMYMLNFAWVSDTEVIRGFVIDATDFPEIWHAWVRIWNKYYDPTFDDPIGQKDTKKLENYKFFRLPKDLFYTNRFTYDDTPEELKTQPMSYRKSFIKVRLAELANRYINENFLLLHPFQFREKYNIDFDEDITLKNLPKVTPLYEVKNFHFTENWVSKWITKLKFFTIKEETLESLIEQLEYNLDWYYFFKWYTEDWKYEYRLWYDIEF